MRLSAAHVIAVSVAGHGGDTSALLQVMLKVGPADPVTYVVGAGTAPQVFAALAAVAAGAHLAGVLVDAHYLLPAEPGGSPRLVELRLPTEG